MELHIYIECLVEGCTEIGLSSVYMCSCYRLDTRVCADLSHVCPTDSIMVKSFSSIAYRLWREEIENASNPPTAQEAMYIDMARDAFMRELDSDAGTTRVSSTNNSNHSSASTTATSSSSAARTTSSTCATTVARVKPTVSKQSKPSTRKRTCKR